MSAASSSSEADGETAGSRGMPGSSETTVKTGALTAMLRVDWGHHHALHRTDAED